MSRKNEALIHDADIASEKWIPITEADQQAVRDQLARVLASLPFSTSKRYPALLNYIVERTLEGHTEGLKERTLGVEVFHRDPQYDTNADPVVRIAAGEVRKRLAQYYYDSAHVREIHIEVPPGSYVPEFRPCADEGVASAPISAAQSEQLITAQASREHSGPSVQLPPDQRNATRLWLAAPLLCLIAGMLLGAVGADFYRPLRSVSGPAINAFWKPLIDSPGPVWLCIGQVSVGGIELQPNGARNRFDRPYELVLGSGRRLSNLADATTLAVVAGMLESRNKRYSIHGETETTFSDLMSGPSVLIGAYDNDWTIRLSDQLRFHFDMNADAKEQWIVDRQKPEERIAPRAYGSPVLDTRDAYAVISRVRDPSTGQMVVSLAGIGSNGTKAAGIFVSEPQYLEDFAKHAPSNWERANLQLVITADVVDGSVGRPYVVSSYIW